MSAASDKGRRLELLAAKMVRHKLKGAKIARDSRSGAGDSNKADLSDWYGGLPLHVEVKNQKTIKIPEWFRQAMAGAGYRQPPAVVFAMDEEVLCTLRFDDVLDMIAEIAQQQATIAELRAPMNGQVIAPFTVTPETPTLCPSTCRNGHLISAGQTKCNTKGCPFSHGYKPKKEKAK